MMDLATIQALADEATKEAEMLDLEPLTYNGDEEDLHHMPYMGDYVPEGWVKTANEYFVDSSGFGSPGEAALTWNAFVEKCIYGRGYGITQAGQFQVYVQEYETS